MRGRRNSLLLGLLIGTVISIIFAGGFIAGNVTGRDQANSAAGLSNPDVKDFLSAYRVLTQSSYYRPLNTHRLIYAAINGMLGATGDPHTIFLPPRENQTANKDLNGAGFTGIGAVVVPDHQYLQILALVPDAPGAKAGLRPSDVVMKINGRSVTGMSTSQAIAAIHGKSGTIVTLTIERHHGSPFVARVKRESIAPITAYGRMLGHGIGYLDVLSFGNSTAGEVDRVLKSLDAQHMRALMLDLRGNSGGYVDAAQKVVSDFVSHGIVAYEEETAHTTVPLNVIGGRQVVHGPVAVLVDGGTASAAEITAAALRDDGGAKLIGSQTYGKGSMQSVYSLTDGSSVRITDRLWLTPRKKSIGQVGLKPDIPVSVFESAHPSQPDPALAIAEKYLLTRLSR